jgi:hypothetical protein
VGGMLCRIAIKMPEGDIYDEIYPTNMLSTNNTICGAARFLRGE